MDRPDRKLEATAYHEAGHAVACFVLDRPFTSITLDPGGDLLGRVEGIEKVIPEPTRSGIVDLHRVVIALAGNAAERRFTGRHDNRGAWYDHQHACDLARGTASDGNAHLADDSVLVRAIVRAGGREAAALVEQHWAAVAALASALQERGTLAWFEAASVCAGAAMPATPMRPV